MHLCCCGYSWGMTARGFRGRNSVTPMYSLFESLIFCSRFLGIFCIKNGTFYLFGFLVGNRVCGLNFFYPSSECNYWIRICAYPDISAVLLTCCNMKPCSLFLMCSSWCVEEYMYGRLVFGKEGILRKWWWWWFWSYVDQ